MTTEAARPEKELLLATRPFTEENRAKGWLAVISSFALLYGLTAGAMFAPWWPLRLVLGLVTGLMYVRVFCLFHDFQHGALLRQSKPAELLFWLFGTSMLTTPSVWKETHNYHHAHTAKIIGSHIGSFPVVTTAMWKDMSPAQRRAYRLVRSPLNVVLAVFTAFTLGMAITPFLRAPKKHWGGIVGLLFVYGLMGVSIYFGRFDLWFFGWLLPMWFADMLGTYLFYVQHNFPEAHIASREHWTFSKAALESSSYLVMGPVMNFFTANIGFHHVHHLNAAIPYYRLPEAMAAIPELQHPGRSTLKPSDVAEAFKLKIWDPEADKMVPFPSA